MQLGMVGLGRMMPFVAVATVCAVTSGCSNSGRFAGPSWNLTGGKDTLPMPSQPVYATPTQPPVSAPGQPQPPVVYRGGRDPVTGRALPPVGSRQTIEQMPLAPPAEPRSAPMQAGQTPIGQPSSYRPARPGTVEVKPGQSLAIIASEHRVSIASLMTANQLRDPYVIPGQQLVIPPR